MNKKSKIIVIGCGRIARAARNYLAQYPFVKVASFLSRDSDAKDADLLIGALAGEIGKKCLDLALKYRKNLIDISDIDPPEYLKRKKEIERRDILVIPGCGFSPGLVNFIVGRRLHANKKIQDIEIRAGSLSPREYFYPFLWCFEDIVVEHTIPSRQRVGGRLKKFPPFAGYQRERHFGIATESYYCASGFENILKSSLHNFTVRVVRPEGFKDFFSFIKGYGLLEKRNLSFTKNMLEAQKSDNLTFAEIKLKGKNSKQRWLLKSYARKNEALNSMQKITAAFPAAVGKLILQGKIQDKGLLFLDKLARVEGIFQALLKETAKKGISILYD